jgi:hypothetical protein
LRERALWAVAAAIAPLIDECTLLRVAAQWIREGKALDDESIERIALAEHRIDNALSVLRPKLTERWI